MPAPPALDVQAVPPAVGGVEDAAAPPEPVCAACGGGVVGPYCHACGERRPRPEDERLGSFLREQFHEATSADGKLWRSLKALFVPGKLTVEYFSGRRGLYVRPIRIFLVANVAFFFTLSAFGATSAFLGSADGQREMGLYGEWATSRLAAGSEAAGVEQDVYDAAFDQKSGTLATTLIGLFVPGFALCLALALFWTRASGVRYLVFSTHYVAFAMAGTLALALVWVPLVFVGNWLGSGPLVQWASRSMDPVVMTMVFAYLVAAVRRAYAVRWWQAGLVSAVVGFGLSPLVTTGYRLVLFLVTLWTVDVPAP
ncbi:DUF3667 domain-containing protein [Rubrivirga litoralis]|uniref:DUF3667 domain-containing protein n=1 Tax=Rubrivirga litoralis TaxID=3075598 RepID=A0ABU3BMP0_9BACT|nr:DUF3667 domain-containing protein [Rubrivirga sp. F394]MDT0630541.1 DUF3667 domain-containing protein [Rubrivirga sp. F394]